MKVLSYCPILKGFVSRMHQKHATLSFREERFGRPLERKMNPDSTYTWVSGKNSCTSKLRQHFSLELFSEQLVRLTQILCAQLVFLCMSMPVCDKGRAGHEAEVQAKGMHCFWFFNCKMGRRSNEETIFVPFFPSPLPIHYQKVRILNVLIKSVSPIVLSGCARLCPVTGERVNYHHRHRPTVCEFALACETTLHVHFKRWKYGKLQAEDDENWIYTCMPFPLTEGIVSAATPSERENFWMKA